MTLDDYKLLGRSGLRASPLSLGTMTFGSGWGWGPDGDEVRRIFDLFVDRGGNFVDTSVNYTVIASPGHLDERAIEIAEEAKALAEEVGSTPSRVALAWTLANPTVVSPIVGARTLAQAEDNLAAQDLVLTPEQVDRLNRDSAPNPIFPARFTHVPSSRN
jgi:aryl-alcohol dehydrogenase-like predicted oxidoreductase